MTLADVSRQELFPELFPIRLLAWSGRRPPVPASQASVFSRVVSEPQSGSRSTSVVLRTYAI
jgi:hypothetical protein